MDPDERDTDKQDAGKSEAGGPTAESASRSAAESGDDAWAEVTDPVPGAAASEDSAEAPRDAAAADGPRVADAPKPEDTAGAGAGRGDPWARLGEEARRLAESLTGQDGDGTGPPPSARFAEEAPRLAESLAGQAEAVREQVARRHPEVAAHLAAAGAELASAYRAFVGDRERRWAARPAEKERIRLDDEDE